MLPSDLSAEFLEVAGRQPLVRPWAARPRRLVFTVALTWLGLAAAILVELLDRKGRR